MPYRPTIIPNLPASTTPTILRANLHHQVIRQVNNNTIAVGPPRPANQEARTRAQALGAQFAQEELRQNTVDGAPTDQPPGIENVRMSEIRRDTSTVRVTNPENEDQYVDVARIDRVLMFGSDGKTYELQFVNS